LILALVAYVLVAISAINSDAIIFFIIPHVFY
jgi:hypothetical protein